MMKYNEANERLKRDYLRYLKEAKRQSEQSLDAAAAAINRFESYTRHKDFKSFNREQAIGFKRHLAEQISRTTGERLSKSTVRSTLAALRSFAIWLADRPGFRSRITYSDAEYFNPSDRDTQIALSPRQRPVPTIEQIRHTLRTMPAETVVERRDRALMAFILATGCRDKAAASVKLKHVNLAQRVLYQDPREVETKRAKTITTYFFPVGDDITRIVIDWIDELRSYHGWGLDDPLFPATEMRRTEVGDFQASGLKRAHWSNADPIRRIFKQAFSAAGLGYFHPHSFRKTLARLGLQVCKSPEDLKVWSQNLGHTHVLTTLTSYGHIDEHRQGEIMRRLAEPVPDEARIRDFFHSLMAQLPQRP